MRRLLHSALLLLTVAALVAPLPAGESLAAPAPICCLGHGEHHCMGQMLGGGPDSFGFSAQNKCPYAPLALAAIQASQLAPPVGKFVLVAAQHSSSFVSLPHEVTATSAVAIDSERGPPATSL
jgi:hypothetical protein